MRFLDTGRWSALQGNQNSNNMRSQDDSKLNININFNWEKQPVKGRKLDSKAEVIIQHREQPFRLSRSDENDVELANKVSLQPKPKKKKSKKKKEKKKSSKENLSQKQRLDEKNREIRQMNAQRRKDSKRDQKENRITIPWGLNQERLRNYFEQEKLKQQHLIQQQQKRSIKTENDLKNRRDQLGVSFLNKIPEAQIRNKLKSNRPDSIKGQKSISYHTKPDHPKPLNHSHEEILQYKEFKFRMQQLAKQEQKRREYEKQIKIHQNLVNLNQFIQQRNRSLSCDNGRQRKKRRAASTAETVEKGNKKILLQFRDNNDRPKLIQPSSQHTSMRQPNSSIYQFMSNSSSNMANESDPEEDIGNLDDSFYSQKIKLVTLQDCGNEEVYSSQRDWDEQDKKEIEEIRTIEKAAVKNQEKRQRSLHDEQAATKIQKVWRGYKTRQILKYYQDYFQKEEEEIGDVDMNQLTQSQVQELIKMGYIEQDSDGNIKIVQESCKSEHSMHRMSALQRKNNSEAEGPRHIFDAEAYQDYVEGFSESANSGKKSNELPKLQEARDQKENQNSVTVGFKKKKRLSIDVEEIEKEYNQCQKQVELSEMRSALGSESLIKSLREEEERQNSNEKSVFEQSSFQDFVQSKFKELLQREKMDELIQMRQNILEERHKQQKKTIADALSNQQISPKTFEAQNKKLERWVTKQRKDLEQKRVDMERGVQSTYETFMKTQRDLLFMKQISQSNSQSYIKVIDSFSQESVLYSEASLRNSIIDIQQQNIQLFGDQDLSKSAYSEDDIRNQNSSPSEMEPLPPFNLQKLAQSQVLRVSDIVKDAQPMSDKQADSYAIVISNMLITQEIQSLQQELQRQGIDIYEMVNRMQLHSYNQQLKLQTGPVQVQPAQPRGFKTNLQQVKAYLQHVLGFVTLKSQDDLVKCLNIPLGPSSMEMLQLLRIDQDISMESDYQYAQTIVLTSQLFGEIEEILVEKGVIKSNNKSLLELEHIHNKAIFDALNEALDYHRPFGINGQPFSWKPDCNRLLYRKRNASELPSIMKKSVEKVVEWCQCLAGIMIDKEDAPYPKVLMYDQECLAQIKEDRIVRMLSQEVLEQDDRWINYDQELAEVGIDLAQCVFDHLIEEMVDELTK